MQQSAIVYNIAAGQGGQHTLTANFVDTSGTPITGLTGYNFLWNFSDNGAILTVNGPLASGNPTIPVTPTGAPGTSTGTVSATKSGSTQSFNGTFTITVQGAIAGIVVTSD